MEIFHSAWGGVKNPWVENSTHLFFFVPPPIESIASQEEYDPGDPANPCVNYPTEEYDSYADCDEDFLRKSLPPDLKPFWAVENISEATRNFTMNTELYENLSIGK